ncbi:competence protein CoiA family protein [Fredinandcohnia sp. QZ13]|uniref:competence protein CoiA n=1 Tax=Fredinandcohnia sp. QZ13 TaxID=3073144 RepID=UPI00285348AE|nr:competence protein CoiA family protein [Fredinandcohnia sp. QZ13]MDR4887006.1 competence protein CoiA family protein [Fredinandcohnia sp. QZ13]
MFVALRENGEYLSLVEKWERSDLLELRSHVTFHCPACQSKVQLKAGLKKTPHFAHLKGVECTVKSEPESEYHLAGKRQLFQWFQTQGYDVKLEPFLPEISQRPDLLVTTSNKRFAIEYQCSQLDYPLFKKRSDSYKKEGIVPIWILGAKWFKRMSTHSVKLSPFQWLFATSFNQPIQPCILYYCPDTSTFVKLSNLHPFTTGEIFCSIYFYKEKGVSFLNLLEPGNHTFTLQHVWRRKKQKWRASYSIYNSNHLTSFLTTLYQKRIPPAYLPGEAGLPVPSSYWFHTPPMIWQMWILLDLLLQLRKGEPFFFSTIMEVISKRIDTKEIVIRQLPLVSHTQYSLAVEEYLQVLVKAGSLKKMSKTKYEKTRDFIIPMSLDRASAMDEKVLASVGKHEENGFVQDNIGRDLSRG